MSSYNFEFNDFQHPQIKAHLQKQQGACNSLHLKGVNLSIVEQTQLSFTNSLLEEVVFANALSDLTIADSKVTSSSLHQVGTKVNNWQRTSFSNCSMQEVQLNNSRLKQVEITDCDLRNAHFENTQLHHCNLSQTDISYSNWHNCYLRVDMSGVQMSHSRFYNTVFVKMNFSGKDLDLLYFENCFFIGCTVDSFQSESLSQKNIFVSSSDLKQPLQMSQVEEISETVKPMSPTTQTLSEKIDNIEKPTTPKSQTAPPPKQGRGRFGAIELTEDF